MPWYRIEKYFDEGKREVVNVEGHNLLAYSEKTKNGHPDLLVAIVPIDAMGHQMLHNIGTNLKEKFCKNVLILGDNIGLFKLEPISTSIVKKIVKTSNAQQLKELMKDGVSSSVIDEFKN